MSIDRTLDDLHRERVIMVLRSRSSDDARRAVTAARAGGLRAIEVTFSVPDAVSVIAELASEHGLVVGAGTVTTLEQAKTALDAGARYLVSPGLDEEILAFAVQRQVLLIPGIFTPSEALRAVRLGAVAVKLFPAGALGPSFLSSLIEPLPDLRVVPSGGVSVDNAAEWMAAGAFAVGMGGALSPTGAIDDAAMETITNRSRDALASTKSGTSLT